MTARRFSYLPWIFVFCGLFDSRRKWPVALTRRSWAIMSRALRFAAVNIVSFLTCTVCVGNDQLLQREFQWKEGHGRYALLQQQGFRWIYLWFEDNDSGSIALHCYEFRICYWKHWLLLPLILNQLWFNFIITTVGNTTV